MDLHKQSFRWVLGLCLLVLVLLITPGLLPAQTSDYNVQVQCLKVFPSESGHYYRAAVKLLSDGNDSLIVFCRAELRDSENAAFVFLRRENKWTETTKVCKGNPEGVILGGKFKLITFGNRWYPQDTFEVFDLTNDLQISSQPTQSLDLSSSRKFKKEGGRDIESIAGGDRPGSFLVLGEYWASNLNPLTFLGRLISAGHAGIVELPFVAQITDGKVTGFYDLQTKFEDRDYVTEIRGITEHHTMHVTWIKGKNYSPAAPKVMYAQFNLDTHKWSDVSELFKGVKYDNKFIPYFKEPSLIVSKDGIVHCSWAYAEISESWKYAKSSEYSQLSIGNAGVFYRSKDANDWGPVHKVADSVAYQSKVSIGNDQSVHIFWVDYQRKIYHAYKNTNGWQETSMIYEDPNMGWFVPFDAKVDLEGNFHLVYIRSFPIKKEAMRFVQIPGELVYVKISKVR